MNGRTNSVGCFGVFAVFCLLLMTAAVLASLWWLDPNWVDQRAWWKPAPLADNAAYQGPADPFAGTWNGKLFLAEGSFVEPLVQKVKEQAVKELENAKAQAARAPADKQAEAQKQVEALTKAVAMAEKAVRGAGQFARLGVPVQVTITPARGGYEMQVLKVVAKDVSKEKNTKFAMRRSDGRTLLFSPQADLPPMTFHLHRPGEVRVQQEVHYTSPVDGSPKTFTVRWVLYRQPAATSSP